MENSLFPAYIVLDYHSDKGQHKMTLPTREWQSAAGTNGVGGYEAWDSSTADARDMIQAFGTAMKAIMPAQVTLDGYTIYTMETPTSPPIARVGGSFTAYIGTATTPGWYQAVQVTIGAKDTEYADAKLVLLDGSSFNNFAPVPYGSLDPLVVDLLDVWMSDTWAFASRNGARVTSWKSYRATLNAKLEAEYWGK